jgi:exodeoxyribonuclease VII small subunit
MPQKTFENALKELEDIVAKLEQGETSLEEALELFEKGIKLSRICSERLEQAEKKIRILTESPPGENKTEEWNRTIPE